MKNQLVYVDIDGILALVGCGKYSILTLCLIVILFSTDLPFTRFNLLELPANVRTYRYRASSLNLQTEAIRLLIVSALKR